jgi:hypothetical protein
MVCVICRQTQRQKMKRRATTSTTNNTMVGSNQKPCHTRPYKLFFSPVCAQ